MQAIVNLGLLLRNQVRDSSLERNNFRFFIWWAAARQLQCTKWILYSTYVE